MIYLHSNLNTYCNVFNKVKKEKLFADHSIYEWRTEKIVSPNTDLLKAATPKNLHLLRIELQEKKLIIIDLVTTKEPVVQIVDHRNESGQNSLIGRTPYNNLSKFPDMSNLYNKKHFGLTQKTVRCIGPKRYNQLEVNDTSAIVSFISLPAYYVGWEMTAIGWNKDYDPQGLNLQVAINCLI
tara:strand:- start:11524 stop:12069 length:546 start_codon:yes stop_codon:yes gene_type:complete